MDQSVPGIGSDDVSGEFQANDSNERFPRLKLSSSSGRLASAGGSWDLFLAGYPTSPDSPTLICSPGPPLVRGGWEVGGDASPGSRFEFLSTPRTGLVDQGKRRQKSLSHSEIFQQSLLVSASSPRARIEPPIADVSMTCPRMNIVRPLVEAPEASNGMWTDRHASVKKISAELPVGTMKSVPKLRTALSAGFEGLDWSETCPGAADVAAEREGTCAESQRGRQLPPRDFGLSTGCKFSPICADASVRTGQGSGQEQTFWLPRTPASPPPRQPSRSPRHLSPPNADVSSTSDARFVAGRSSDVSACPGLQPRPQRHPEGRPAARGQAEVTSSNAPDLFARLRADVSALLATHILPQPYEDVRIRYELGERLGNGMMGLVLRCTEKVNGQSWACKQIAKSKLVCREDVTCVKGEVAALQALRDHTAVVRLKEVVEDEEHVHIITEVCQGGDLFEAIIARNRYPEPDAARVIRSILSVVKYMHSQGLMHRDLKPENIVLVNKESRTRVRIIDFGQTTAFVPGEVLTEFVGSAFYVAPEVLDREYGPEADMWSVGTILYAMLSGSPPFWAEEKNEIFAKIRTGKFDMETGVWKKISEGAKDLVRRMLTADVNERITGSEAKMHPWILRFCKSKPPLLQYPLSPLVSPSSVLDQPCPNPSVILVPHLPNTPNPVNDPESQPRLSPSPSSLKSPSLHWRHHSQSLLPSPGGSHRRREGVSSIRSPCSDAAGRRTGNGISRTGLGPGSGPNAGAGSGSGPGPSSGSGSGSGGLHKRSESFTELEVELSLDMFEFSRMLEAKFSPMADATYYTASTFRTARVPSPSLSPKS